MRDSNWRRRRLLVLCYHGVTMHDEHEWSPNLYVTQERLRARLRLLADGGYAILPLTDALTRLYAGTLPSRSVAITFDDGYTDFVHCALPVLREFSCPVTLYLTTFYARARLPVFFPMLDYVLWQGRRSTVASPRIEDIAQPILARTAAERQRTWEVLCASARDRDLNAVAKDALIGRVATALGVDYDSIRARGTLQIMPPEMIRDLPHDLVDVQLHTHRHRMPTDRESFLREIGDNARVIRELRGEDVVLNHFCYPSGEYRREAFALLTASGVSFATTCEPALATRRSHQLLIPRFVDSMSQSAEVFESWASGFSTWLPRRVWRGG